MSTKSKPLVYCIILNLNGENVLPEALASIQAMTYANFRILLVDNGSTDNAIAEARKQFPEIEIIENNENLGFGGGNNVGMQYAIEREAEWIFLLNNDIVVDQQLLSELVAVGESDPQIGALGPKIYYHNAPEKIWYAGGKVNFFAGMASHRGIRQIDTGQFDEIFDCGYLTGCALLVRSSVLQKIGLFDEVFFPSYVEDADLSLRIRRAGYTLKYVPKGKLWHKVSSFSGGGMTPLKTTLKTAHSLLFFSRYANWYHWLTMPVFIFLGSVVFVFRELLNGRFDLVKALLAGFTLGLKKWWQPREPESKNY